MILQLKKVEPFARGGNRLCFVHPDNPARCIKVRRPDFTLADCRRKKGFPKNLRPLASFDDNREEYLTIQQLQQWLGDSVFDHVYRCFGFVDTDLGPGLEAELIRDGDGLISLSLKQYLWEVGYPESCQWKIKQLISFWREKRIPSRDLLTHNIVVQRDSQGAISRLVVIDGLGDPTLIPFRWLPRSLQERRIDIRLQRFESRLAEFVHHCAAGKQPSQVGVLLHRDDYREDVTAPSASGEGGDMRLMQILLSQSEAGAETYFEKVASAFTQDQSITQRLIIESQPSREHRLQSAGVDFRTLPMGKVSKALLYNHRLKTAVAEFNPDLIVTWVNRASRKCPPTSAVVVGRLGGYYDINNYRNCDHLIVNTPDLVRYVVEEGWPESQVSMISNFGELPAALEVDEPLPEFPDDHKVLLTLGRLHPKKAQDTLIKALPLIPDTTLLIAGSGELEGELKQLAEDLGVAERVHFLGTRKDVRQLFQVADLCVFPSRFEPLGNVVLEAWAMEIPIIAAASQGPSWLISDGEDGLLFEVDDVEQCAEKVNLLLSRADLAETLVENGRSTFQKRFSMPVILGQYKQLFAKLLADRRK